MPPFETFSHQADIGIRGYGVTQAEAFANGAKALFSLMVDLKEVKPKEEVKVSCQADEPSELFVEWLNQLLAVADLERKLFSRFEVEIPPTGALRGKAWGEKIDPRKQTLLTEVKGATYSQLEVKELEDGRWLAQCVVDV